MCEPVTMITTGLSMAGQVAGHQAENNAIAGRNRAKLRNHQEQNRLYDRDVMFDRAQYRNDIQLEDIKQDDVYRAMMDQWTEADAKLNRLFAQSDQKIEKAVIKMYENEYAGTQTGRTAARLAGKSAKKLGQEKSEILHNLMMSKEEAIVAKDMSRESAASKSRDLYEQVRFAPIHGVTPMAPELEPKKSSAGLILGLAGSAIGGFQQAGAFKTPKINTDFANTAPSGQEFGAMASDIRMKDNVKEIGISPKGYKIYEFNYKGNDTRYRGAMAQDVITKLPQAVGVRDNYFTVNYNMIDIDMEVV